MTDTTEYSHYTSKECKPQECLVCGGMVYPAFFPDDGEFQDGPLRPEYSCRCGEYW